VNNSITLHSPAKLNLYLKVLNKRPDGYHNIETLFERINLFDDICLTVNQNRKIRVVCDHPHVPTDPKNLVYQAAQILQKDYGVTQGVTITIKKRIPVAAGLAGGSTNAATVLLGLNQIWGLNLSQSKLVSYAARIGSDVAFFLYDCSWALGTGRGEQIKRINLSAKFWHILVIPRLKIYSWKVYSGIKGRRMKILTKKDDDVNILIRSLKKYDFSEIGRRLTNDLEDEVVRLCPKLVSLKERLQQFSTQGVMVSGSGPGVFGVTKTEQEAKMIKSVLEKRFSQVFVVQTL